jgi:hypothetical protein
MLHAAPLPTVTSRLCVPVPSFLQLYTQVEAFSSAISKLQELGLSVNVEESELVYRGTAGKQHSVRSAFLLLFSSTNCLVT